MEARVRVAFIKKDFTWEEVFVDAGGANWTAVFANAEIKVRQKCINNSTYATSFLAVKAIEAWVHTVEET